MFGRVRAPSSSPEELERPTPKLLKHDSLSVYESTLLKLRVGSLHAQTKPPEELHAAENDEMDMEANCNSTSAACSEAILSPQSAMVTDDGADTSKTVSINRLFSRYKESKTALLPHDQAAIVENHCPPSIPPNPGKWQCLGNKDQPLEPDCISSITVGSM